MGLDKILKNGIIFVKKAREGKIDKTLLKGGIKNG